MATHQEQAVIDLREMILTGVLGAGQRVTETALTAMLNISRTPVRYALTALSQEGLLTSLGKRGYVVSTFRVEDVLGAIDVRGALEGLAARTIAECGLAPELRRQLGACLASGDALFAKGHLVPGDAARYSEMNRTFHDLITDASGNDALVHLLGINSSVPFSAAGAFAFDQAGLDFQYRTLNYAHMQHHAIVQALEQGEGARAEALMREHTNAAKGSLSMDNESFVANGAATLPGHRGAP
ncbi:MAG: GntR family transcriptional regulator [Pseudomonadota bacterium]